MYYLFFCAHVDVFVSAQSAHFGGHGFMLRKSLFALSSILVLGSVTACGDDDPKDPKPVDPNVPEVTCEEDPTQEHCEKDYSNAREGNVYSLVTGLGLPAEADEGGEGPSCCFDYDGDGQYDNALGKLLPLVSLIDASLDLDELLGGVFADGDITLVFQHEKYPTSTEVNGNFDTKLFMGDSDSSYEDRLNHKGVFTLEGDALATINGAVNRRSVVEARADSLPISLDLSSFGADISDIIPGGSLTLPLSVVRLNFHVSEADGEGQAGIYNANPATEGDTDVTLVTTAKGKPINFLSGGLHGDEIADLANDILGNMCDYTDPIITFDATKGEAGEEGELAAPLFDIREEAIDAFNASDDETCNTVGGFLPAISVLGTMFDVDSTGNGIADTLSIGLNIQISGGTVAAE